MISIQDIILNPTCKVVYEAEGRDVGGALGVGSPRPWRSDPTCALA
ncbi:MAG: hypothetical protein L6435_08015 [Anaerolineae bacterium]|nr:hypothetical protein [Anaerolineae bacterium]